MATRSKHELPKIFKASHDCQSGLNSRAARSRGSRLQRIDLGRQSRQFAGDRIAMHHPFRRRPVELGLGDLKRALSGALIAARDRRLDLLHEGTHAAHPRAIDGGARLSLTKAFFRRFMMRHCGWPELERARLYRWRGRASTTPAIVPISGCGTPACASPQKRPCLPSGLLSRKSSGRGAVRSARPLLGLFRRRG